MNEMITVPADADKVTLTIQREGAMTLRSLLPQVKGDVELVVEDAFEGGKDCDLYRLRASYGGSLLHKLKRSRIVEGEALLDLVPSVQRLDPQTSLINGSFATLTGTGCIQLWVRPPVPDEED